MRRERARLASAAACALSLVWPTMAFADPATAEALFREGRQLLEQGDIDAACLKLAESEAQEASSGTLLNLALCHEKQGKVASAWAEYAAASRLARTQGRTERADVAAAKAAALEPRLGRLEIRTRPVPGLKIVRGAEELGQGALGTPVPVDAGSYDVVASAPGYTPWRGTIEITDGETKTLDIPTLEMAPSPNVVSADPGAQMAAKPARARAGQSALGWAIGGSGVVALGIGIGFGVSSLASYDTAGEKCPARRACSAEATTARDRAETQAWVANIAIGASVVALAVGAYLILSRPKDVALAFTAAPSGDRRSWIGRSELPGHLR